MTGIKDLRTACRTKIKKVIYLNQQFVLEVTLIMLW